MHQYAKMHVGITYKQLIKKIVIQILFCVPLVLLMDDELMAFESTIYISAESHNGAFEDAEYTLNNYRVRFTGDNLFINNEWIISVAGSLLLKYRWKTQI